eukprot:COSAG04_NODE_3382_length_2870_cov_2.066763_1_plen_110_part_00
MTFDNASLLQQFSTGDTVKWLKADSDVPAGTVGTVEGPSTNKPGNLRVSFPKGVWGFSPSDLRSVMLVRHLACRKNLKSDSAQTLGAEKRRRGSSGSWQAGGIPAQVLL